MDLDGLVKTLMDMMDKFLIEFKKFLFKLVMVKSRNHIAIILCGGKIMGCGLFQESFPKQYLNIENNDSLSFFKKQ